MASRKKRNTQTQSTDKPMTASNYQTDESDPIERIIELQEHRYDPGYYTGGKIDPLLTAPRPNKYGYYLIVCAALTLIVVVLAMRAGVMPLYGVAPLAPFLLLVFLAGFKLIRKQGRRYGKTGRAKKSKE